MSKKIDILKIFPGILILCLAIGIITNIMVPVNIKLSALLVILVTVGALSVRRLKFWLQGLKMRTINIWIAISLVAMVIVQLIVLRYLPATVYHDPFRVLVQAETMSTGARTWNSSTYFWRYPNNVTLAFIMSLWLRFTNLFGLSTNVGLHILSMTFLDLLIVMTIRTIRVFSKNRLLLVATVAFFVLSPFAYTYYLQVFYSDLPIMLAIISCFNILFRWSTFSKIKKGFAIPFIFFLILLAQLIKPNFIVFTIAILIVAVVLMLKDRKLVLKMLMPLVVIIFGFAAASPVRNAINHEVNFTANTRYKLPTTHWIWMSYNPKSHGAYVAGDVKKMEKLPNTKARQTYLKKALPQRLKKLGIRGIINRWLVKIGILLNVGRLSIAYTGGYISAPRLYVSISPYLKVIGNLVMRLGIIFLYLFAILKLVTFLRTESVVSAPVSYLAIIMAVGYIAFHTLLWETESRYGQPILPLLLIVVSQENKPFVWTRLKTSAKRWFGAGIIAVTSVIFLTENVPLFNHQSTIVAAQRSQLSEQYNAQPTAVDVNAFITQNVVLKHQATSFSIGAAQNTDLEATLVNLDNHETYQFVKHGSDMIVKHALKAGQYEIMLRNIGDEKQYVLITRTQNYKLAAEPIYVNGHADEYGSLVYLAKYKR